MAKERIAKKHRTLPTLEGLAATLESVAAALDRLSDQMLAGFSFFGERVGSLEIKVDALGDRVSSLEVKFDGLEFATAANTSKIEGLHRRIDDIVEMYAPRRELAETNRRLGRVEGHLGLA